MGIFRAAHVLGGAKRPPSLKSVTHILQWWNLPVIPYLKKIQKIYQSRDTPPEFCWHQHFFTGNQQILLYQEIQIQIAFWYIISNSFTFSWNFEDFSINLVIILMVSAKMPTPGPLEITVFWNKGYGVIDSCRWRHQQNFIIWFKLHCRFVHVTQSLVTLAFPWEKL